MRAMHRIPLALTTAMTVLALAACGSDGSGSTGAATSAAASPAPASSALTKDAYIRQGDAICARLETQTAAVPSGGDESEFGAYIREVVALAEAAQTDFAALTPPADGQSVHTALLDSLKTSIATAKGAATAAEGGDTVSAGDLLTQADTEGSASNAAAQAYGFQDCGKVSEDDGAPGG